MTKRLFHTNQLSQTELIGDIIGDRCDCVFCRSERDTSLRLHMQTLSNFLLTLCLYKLRDRTSLTIREKINVRKTSFI